jgi:hypothetical protein
MREILDELATDDQEHPSAWLTDDETGWTLDAYQSGLLIWQNRFAPPRHINNVPRERVLELWVKLANGKIDEIEKEPWSLGYFD